ncbi:MAG: ADOP family duplicated permease [Gemmatimonadales bacterium]
MKRDPAWRRYLRFFGPDPARDLDDELGFHIAMMAAELERQGLSPEAARARAEREFGDATRAREACRAIDTRRRRRDAVAGWWGGLGRDFALAVRGLRRAPGFALIASFTLGLGLGATAAIFTVVDGVLLRPLPYPEPERLVRLWEVSPQGDDRNVVSEGNYLDWAERATSFAAIGAHTGAYGVTVTGDREPARLQQVSATPSLFGVLGARPVLGRLPTEADAEARDAVVLAHSTWQRRYGGDSAILGRALVLNDRPARVLAVMGADFTFPNPDVDVWLPVPESALDQTSRRSHNWMVVGRLADGVAAERARAELAAIAGSLAGEYPEFMSGWSATAEPLHADLVASIRPLLRVLMAGATLVLMIACINVANLLLARAVRRSGEVALRGALGAGRGHLIRQFLVEGLLLAGLGGAAGVGVAALLLDLLLGLAPDSIPRLEAVGLDGRALGFAALAALASTVLFALVPALRLAAGDPQLALRAAPSQGGDRSHGRLRAALLVGEVAISMVLLAGAGLLVRSYLEVRRADLGFRSEGLIVVPMDLPRSRYPRVGAQVVFYRELLDRIDRMPGVERAGSTSEAPAGGAPMTFSFAIEGREAPNPTGRLDPVPLEAVSVGYLETLGIPIVAGRAFAASDREDAPPVALVNQTLARTLWPDGDAVGSRIQFNPSAPWLEVVGVVGDARMRGADQPPGPIVYVATAQRTWDWLSWQNLVLRVADGVTPGSLAGALRSAVRELDPELPVSEVRTMDDLYRASTARQTFATILLGTFAVAALALGLIGLYGVLAGSVAARRRELAVRMSLGASREAVLRLVLREALVLTGLGLLVGSGVALALTRMLGALLYGVSPLDPLTFLLVAALVTVASVAAALLPARRASRVDPMVAIRAD